MTARRSIEPVELPRDVSIAAAASWPARRPPSLAMAEARAALEAQAAKTALAIIARRASDYALRPAYLDAMEPGLSSLSPQRLKARLEALIAIETVRPRPYMGFGGEVCMINLRAAAIYAGRLISISEIAGKAEAREGAL